MKQFMDEHFLLQTKTAQKLYHEYAKDQMIYDYHCHLDPKEIAENKKFSTITDAWLGGDHYKWRAMRANGVPEELVTGKDVDPYEKFLAWAGTMENALGNPLYHWTHLELQRYFGIHEVLNTKNAKAIYEEANRQFKENENLSVTGIMKQFKVYAVGTTDDPADDLAYHKQIASQKEVPATVIPSFRPDKALNIEKETFSAYMESLETVSGKSITLVADVIEILISRLDFFVSLGCKASDHALVTAPAVFKSEREVNEIFAKKMNGKCLNHEEVEAYKTFVLTHLAKAYAKRNIAMQLHFAAIRDNNSLMYKKLGPDTGFDASHDKNLAEGLSAFLNNLSATGEVPKTILYSLNPKDYYSLATLMGCYQDGIPGKMQLGSAWWFADHKDGMEEQMKLLGNVGLLPRFIGMLTDSRSFLSYSRHEYFRRILCNILGNWAEEGEVPYDMEMLGKVVENISFGNAKAYFEG
ncbi:MAG: glucuronate isomerase [Sphaerochaeta sp.]|jgi:glucuronate isomerase|uniref:Uronate isomerase n=1 Tax=Sphaerochaeta halotolerans TaxID=2293840 RepID=A0A372MJT3_9SPIR|nr:glucuronate isomerase [Sphaerochaeta halotolerans]MBG0767597.1 glucuronate isomerase [Spirochaetaceae bacterium]MDK2859111.1 glucuronate isomerase [Sphaerochaeta sp.]RFU96031.1 glucuronate isomerase [Sphaerochaeta halotolerans]